MTEQSIKCPKCGFEIPMSEALTHQIEEEIKDKYEKELLKAKEDAKLLFEKERQHIEAKARINAKNEIDIEIKDLNTRLEERDKQLDLAKANELELRKRQRELEDKEKDLELELSRRLEQERKLIYEQAEANATEANVLKLREKDLLLDQMRKQIDDLRKRADQGPQERQGEVQELVIEDMLKEAFPADDIEPVAKGKKGGDIVQRIMNKAGQCVGTILWESKRTKNWADVWIPKLKEDQREIKADLAILVSDVLPEKAKRIGNVDGVWVSDFSSFQGLGLALRSSLIELALTRNAIAGQQGKMEVLYNYLSGPQFRQRIEAIMESFNIMRSDLESEKSTMQRHWAKRDKQIERMIINTSGMYGDLQGIIGNELPAIKRLELPAQEEE